MIASDADAISTSAMQAGDVRVLNPVVASRELSNT
jgi:hypothetical protein